MKKKKHLQRIIAGLSWKSVIVIESLVIAEVYASKNCSKCNELRRTLSMALIKLRSNSIRAYNNINVQVVLDISIYMIAKLPSVLSKPLY